MVKSNTFSVNLHIWSDIRNPVATGYLDPVFFHRIIRNSASKSAFGTTLDISSIFSISQPQTTYFLSAISRHFSSTTQPQNTFKKTAFRIWIRKDAEHLWSGSCSFPWSGSLTLKKEEFFTEYELFYENFFKNNLSSCN